MTASDALIDAFNQAQIALIDVNATVRDAERVLRKAKDAQLSAIHAVDYLRAAIEELQRPTCEHHDEPVDEHGKCAECYERAAEHAEHERDTQRLWDQR